jgi:hypothetical protein
MPRLRNRIRRRVAAPIGEQADDEQEEPEDEADQEQPEDESDRPDPTARALQEDAYRRRTSDGGELGDIAPSGISDLSQQVTTGTAASVNIADQFDPGFTRTEIVNRLGMVLSLSFSYDYGRGEWVPDPIDKTERQAVEQELAEDRATDDLTNPVNPGVGTEVDSNGDLKLSDGEGTQEYDRADKERSGENPGLFGVAVSPDNDASEVQATVRHSINRPAEFVLRDSAGNQLDSVAPRGNDTYTFRAQMSAGSTYSIQGREPNDDEARPLYDLPDRPYSILGGSLEGGAYGDKQDGSTAGFFARTRFDKPADEGSATSTFDNPCTASSTRSAQHDVCSRSKDVTVDLYEGDPYSDDSILLRDDISQREDIAAIPDSRTDLQYLITIERGPDGDSPKVSRLGHQLIR